MKIDVNYRNISDIYTNIEKLLNVNTILLKDKLFQMQ